MKTDIQNIFWSLIKKSGKNCNNINKIRKKFKKIYGLDSIKKIDELFNNYYSLIWAKFEPILGGIYDEDKEGFKNFIFHLLSQGEGKINLLLDKKYNKKIFYDVSKFIVEYQIKKKLFEEKSKFQLVQVFKTKNFGNMLVIDNDVQLTESDEVNYHEMISHVPINYFNTNINVLIIGGGDGGTAREVLKHHNVKKVIMVDIDDVVIKASKLHFKIFAPTFDNPKLILKIEDGFDFVKNYTGEKFDIVIIDSTDFNQSIPLFKSEFFINVKKIINDKHIVCFNADNINWNEKRIVSIVKQQKKIFKFVSPYVVYVPTFAGGQYSFCLASDSINPLNQIIDWNFYENKKLFLKYYSQSIHIASFALPEKLDRKLKKYNLKSTKDIKGIHYIIDFEEVPFKIANDITILNDIFDRALKESNMKILDTKTHQFQPQGLTGFYLLAESHLSFHTWPEKNLISLDLYTCGDNSPDGSISLILKELQYPYKMNRLER